MTNAVMLVKTVKFIAFANNLTTRLSKYFLVQACSSYVSLKENVFTDSTSDAKTALIGFMAAV